jgi:hypothetical protein
MVDRQKAIFKNNNNHLLLPFLLMMKTKLPKTRTTVVVFQDLIEIIYITYVFTTGNT